MSQIEFPIDSRKWPKKKGEGINLVLFLKQTNLYHVDKQLAHYHNKASLK